MNGEKGTGEGNAPNEGEGAKPGQRGGGAGLRNGQKRRVC